MATTPPDHRARGLTPLEAIADAVRLKLVRALGERGPSTLKDLAGATGTHFNTVRLHLRNLEEAGLVLRTEEGPHGRGRPRRKYRLVEGWSVPTSDFRLLAEILAGFLLESRCKPAELHQFGANWGRYLAGRPGRHDAPANWSASWNGWAARPVPRAAASSSPPAPVP